MNLHTLSAIEIRNLFLKKSLSAKEIVSYFLDRIDREDGKVGAFLEVYHKEALEKALALDAKLASGASLGRLAAVPIAIKDNLHIEGKKTTAGSKILEHYKAIFTATALKRLLDEDAIFIGKTNMDEFAMGSSTENSAFKKTYNPWDLKRTPGGSSGGSAAAVAAGFAPISLGSDTGGSIRQPAALTGLYGLKPTYGRISRFGLIAFASSLDQIGPMAHTLEDAALAFEVMSGQDLNDSTSLAEGPLSFGNLFNQERSLKGRRLGVPYALLNEGLDPEVKAHFEEALIRAKELGATLEEVDLSICKHALSVYYILAPAEACANLARYDGIGFSKRAEKVKNLEELYLESRTQGFGAEVRRRILMGTFVLSSGHKEAYYKKAQCVRAMITASFKKAFESVDAILLPTSPVPAFKVGELLSPLAMYQNDIFTIPASLAGLPAISIPEGMTKAKLPTSLQIIAPAREDLRLFEIAHHLTSPKWSHDTRAPL